GKKRIKPNYRRRLLRLPDLDHCKRAVLNSLGSPASRRVYEYAIDQFIAWYCSIASLSCTIACAWNRGISPPTPSTSNSQPCTVWLTKLVRGQNLLPESRLGAHCAARSAPDLREALPRPRWRARADSVFAQARIRPNHGTLSRLQTESGTSSER